MKIYQVIQYGGEYEDKYELVEKTFTSKEKAELELERLSKELEDAKKMQSKCSRCKVDYSYGYDWNEVTETFNQIKNCCDISDLKIVVDEIDGCLGCEVICDNNGSWCEYVNGYKIEEFEVEE